MESLNFLLAVYFKRFLDLAITTCNGHGNIKKKKQLSGYQLKEYQKNLCCRYWNLS